MSTNTNHIYDDLLKQYSVDDPRVVGWSNHEAYNKRTQIVRKYACPRTTDKVLDYGCGTMLSYYKEFHPSYYVGYDCNPSSLRAASDYYDIPIIHNTIDDNYLKSAHELLVDDIKYITTKFDLIIVNGVLQDCRDLSEVRDLVTMLSQYMSDHSKMHIITPSNLSARLADNELFLSPYDMVTLAQILNMRFTLSYGELGQHLVLNLYKEV